MPRGSPRRPDATSSGTGDIDMEQRTPGSPLLNPMAGTEARPFKPSSPTTGSTAARRAVVRLLYNGRRRRSGRVQSSEGEHVDLIVPDRAENDVAVEEFLDPVGQVGMTDEQRAQILAGHNADTIAIAGQHYHFVGGQVTDVLAAHAAWLEAHPTYAFERVSD